MEMNIHEPEIELEGKYLVEGFPGVGLVAKIVADYIVGELDMDLYAEIHSEQTPSIAVFEKGGKARSPIRIYVSEKENLLVLKSDAPVSSEDDFIEDLNVWMDENGITPIYQLGIPTKQKPKELHVKGVFSGEGEKVLTEAGIEKPSGFGVVSGPTGGLLEKAVKKNLDAVGITVPSDAQFPDPEAAKALIEQGVTPITGISVDTKKLEESAEEIREKKKKLVKKVRDAEDHETSQAYPREMYI